MEKLTVRTGSANVNASTELFAPTNSGGKIRLLKLIVSADTDGVYLFQDGSGGSTVVALYIEAKKNATIDLTLPGGAAEFGAQGKSLTAGNSLYCDGPNGVCTLTAVCAETGF